MTPFSAIITPTSLTFTSPTGRTYNIDSSHTNWAEAIDLVKAIHAETKKNAPDEEFVADTRKRLDNLVDVSIHINEIGEGKVVVRNGVVYYNDEPINHLITERILWGIQEGFDMTSYMLFLENSMLNPSKRSIDEMYSFMEKNNMGITDDGYVLGYKKIREDFTDIHSGKFDNSPGSVIEMPRNKVNDDFRQTCSSGLHFCSMDYLPHFGSSNGNRVVIVKVNPRDIVSVPHDYNNAKVRCCRYEVISEYTGSDLTDYLAKRPVWSSDELNDRSYYDEDDVNDDDDEFFVDDDTCETCGIEIGYCSCHDDEYCQECGCDLDDCDCDCDCEDVSVDEENIEDVVGDSLDGLITKTDALGELLEKKNSLASVVDVILEADSRIATALADAESLSIDEYMESQADDEAQKRKERDASEDQKRKELEHLEALVRAQEKLSDLELQNFLSQLPRGYFNSWMNDGLRTDLPTSDEIQRMLGSLVAELRTAEIAAGAITRDQSKYFDWEGWLAARAELSSEKIVSEETEEQITEMLSNFEEQVRGDDD